MQHPTHPVEQHPTPYTTLKQHPTAAPYNTPYATLESRPTATPCLQQRLTTTLRNSESGIITAPTAPTAPSSSALRSSGQPTAASYNITRATSKSRPNQAKLSRDNIQPSKRVKKLMQRQRANRTRPRNNIQPKKRIRKQRKPIGRQRLNRGLVTTSNPTSAR